MLIPTRLSGRVAVVTASTDGIGLATARRLAQEGASVMVSSRKQQNVDQAVSQLKGEGLSVAGVVCHVAKKADRQSLLQTTMDKFGKIDILVSNAGINPYKGQPLDISEATYDKLWETNVKATFLLIQETVPLMNKGGAIVIMSSYGAYRYVPLLEMYSVTKTALLGLMKALVTSLANKEIRINTIAPALIDTKMGNDIGQKTKDRFLLDTPAYMRRLGTPEECSGIIAFLVSDDASYITGETVVNSIGHFSRL